MMVWTLMKIKTIFRVLFWFNNERNYENYFSFHLECNFIMTLHLE